MNSENAATIPVILNGVNWFRKFIKIIDSERNFKVNSVAVDGYVPFGARASGHGDGCKCGSLQQYKHDYVIWISHVTVTSQDCHGVPSNGQLDCFFNRLLRPNKENIKAQHYWPWGVHRWLSWCVATPSCSCFIQIDFKRKHIWSNSLRMVMFYNCFQQYKHNYVTGIYHITVTSLEPPNLSQLFQQLI